MRFTNLKGLILASHDVINTLLAILVALALLYFMWGLARMIFRVAGDEKAIEEGKRIMLWGIISLFVMVSVWGIVNFLADSFGFGERGGPPAYSGDLDPNADYSGTAFPESVPRQNRRNDYGGGPFQN
ncbi:MAG: pilin [Patescibacteria group bacterium]